MTTGPRPMRPEEWEAYTLHLQRVPVEAIQAQTNLSRARIAAAVDLGQLRAQAVLQTTATNPAPAPRPRPVRIRKTVKTLPGATIPPSHTLPERTDPLPRQRAAAAELAMETATAPAPAAPVPAPAAPAEPDLEGLARSPKVRAWAAADGWAVPAAGTRLPGAIVLAYIRAHGDNS